ncbi:hypothetical protein MP638_004737 [Amoeboaphelidium occidentale]|nr:hypothetical protein MP638_004737 [Amoeboaphelidium occidentale]
MEFYHLGKHCSQDLCNQLDFLPYKCSGCQKTFCQDHWKFQDHKCPKEDDFLRNRIVPSCPICQVAIPVAKGEDLNAKVDEHISKNCQKPSKTVDPAYNHLCKAQGCRKKEVIPFQCNQCHLNFCVKHRHARDHNCEPKALSQPTRNSPKKQEPASVLSILSSLGSSLLPSFRNKADLTEDDQVAAAIEESLKTYEAEQRSPERKRIQVH